MNDNPEIYDEVEIISYNTITMLRIKTIQTYENIIEGFRAISYALINRVTQLVR